MESKSSDSTDYKVVGGIYFHVETDDRICEILSRASYEGTRLRIYYGDSETGRDWGEVNDIYGYIGRTTGGIKIPILLFNKRSIGGGAILDHCIVKIEYSNKKDGSGLYVHPLYYKEG